MSAKKFQRSPNTVVSNLKKTTSNQQNRIQATQSQTKQIIFGQTQNRVTNITKQSKSNGTAIVTATNIKNNSNNRVSQHRYDSLRKNNKYYKQELLFTLLNKMYYRRKSYCFQVIKQFFLFPDETISSNVSVSSYDRLFYHDQNIHTIIKIYETKQLQAKLWAFINLKTLHIKKKLQKFTRHYENVQQKIVRKFKLDTFHNIHQYTLTIRPIAKAVVRQNTQQRDINSRVYQARENVKIESNTYQRRTQINNTTSPQRFRVVNTSRSPAVTTRRIQSPTRAGIRIIYPSQPTTTVTSDKTTQIKRRQVEINRRQVQIDRCVANIPVNIGERRTENWISYTPPITPITPITPLTLINRVQQTPVKSVIENRTNYQQKQSSRHNINTCSHSHNCQCHKIAPTPATNKQQKHSDHQLVHIVHGDCTINIYNDCTIDNNDKQTRTQQKQTADNNKHTKINNNNQQKQACGQAVCCFSCCCCQFGSKIIPEFDSDGYCLQERIQYLKKLEYLSHSDKISASKV